MKTDHVSRHITNEQVEHYGVPVFNASKEAHSCPYIIPLDGNAPQQDSGLISELANNNIALARSISLQDASKIFSDLAEHYQLTESYLLQMQFVVDMMEDRCGVDDVAVTVNEREDYQYIQPHCEGDSTSPIELFGLYCRKNAQHGGENVLSRIDQRADFSHVKAKEKAILGKDLDAAAIRKLQQGHLDAKDVIESCDKVLRTLSETAQGKVVTRLAPLQKQYSKVSNEQIYTLWDNVTVHDHAFHRLQFDLLSQLSLIHTQTDNGSSCFSIDAKGSDQYQSMMHIERDSDWAPADTDSGDLASTAKLFDTHVIYKMQPGDFLIFNNRAWAHGVNNWNPLETRELLAMYA
ncbi:hypothetical protein FLL45_05470 [Aliikangiella marina]|uniref:Uncharacterized protein n=1 Tax=Aliikangiella marina TaxID=1712262 RepID=A0A545TJI6_9GAMM|nr:TauD/TfdA family dioxygenase [Aliikangiella marina]TQV77394.1 hypothetical protein FLL45_05470 [Aliikangiella marina]